MGTTRVSVDHIRVTTDKRFEDVRAAFERPLGKFDEQVYKSLAAEGNVEASRKRLETMVGPSGFMIFAVHDHGSLLKLVGKPRKALQYIVGNPLFAIEMTQHAIGASLYAPLRVLLYEDAGGKTCFEYDSASTLFGQFKEEHVSRTAAMLDQKLGDLISAAIR
jgi:uncharacterized protein (DUF302 family)